jgi:hypothetical protein
LALTGGKRRTARVRGRTTMNDAFLLSSHIPHF